MSNNSPYCAGRRQVISQDKCPARGLGMKHRNGGVPALTSRAQKLNRPPPPPPPPRLPMTSCVGCLCPAALCSEAWAEIGRGG